MKTPILILAFNRPDLLRKLLDVLSQARINQRKIYFSIDGPRNSRDKIQIDIIRAIIDSFSSSTKHSIELWISEENQGCKLAVSSAISKVLRVEESIIVLEDDCIPSKTFFHYCDHLLNHYLNDNSVMMINGTTFRNFSSENGDYRKSRCAFVWGWATWRRAWDMYDLEMSDLHRPYARNKVINMINQYLGRFSKPLNSLICDVKDKDINTWDAQWAYSIWKNEGATILPAKNLISNIGFGSDSTHTKIITDAANLKKNEMESVSDEWIIDHQLMQALDQLQYEQIQSSTQFIKLLYLNIKNLLVMEFPRLYHKSILSFQQSFSKKKI